MSDCLPGPLCAVERVPETKRNLQLCIICQNVKDTQGNSYLYSMSNGRKTIQNTSYIMQEGLLNGFSSEGISKMNYHLKIFYSNYMTKVEQQTERQIEYKRCAEM